MTEAEFVSACALPDKVAETNNWWFLMHISGVDTFLAELTHGKERFRIVDNSERPIYRPDATEMAGPAVLMLADELGERLFPSGRVAAHGS